MVWFSGGHSGRRRGRRPRPDRWGATRRHPGRRWIDWMDRYVRERQLRERRAGVRVLPGLGRLRHGTAIDRRRTPYCEAASPARPTSTLFLSGTDRLTPTKSSVTSGSAQFARLAGRHVVLRDLGCRQQRADRATAADGQPRQLRRPTRPRSSPGPRSWSGSPRLNVRISAPVAAQTQNAGPGGKLVLFAKLYDVAPDGTQKLQHRLISPVRVRDVTKPVQVRAARRRAALRRRAQDPAGRSPAVTSPTPTTRRRSR